MSKKMSSSTAPELCPVRRPGELQTPADLSESTTQQPAKKKRRSADAVALGSALGQAKREPSTLARRLAQVVSLQQAADRAGGSPPSAAGGAGSVLAQIRITVDEVGQVDLSGYLAEAPAREQEVVMKKTKKEEAEEKEKEAENTKPKKDKKDEEDAEKMTLEEVKKLVEAEHPTAFKKKTRAKAKPKAKAKAKAKPKAKK